MEVGLMTLYVTNKSPNSDGDPNLGIPSPSILWTSPCWVIWPGFLDNVTVWSSRWGISISNPNSAYLRVISTFMLRLSTSRVNTLCGAVEILSTTSPALMLTYSSAASLNLSSWPSGHPFSMNRKTSSSAYIVFLALH